MWGASLHNVYVEWSSISLKLKEHVSGERDPKSAARDCSPPDYIAPQTEALLLFHASPMQLYSVALRFNHFLSSCCKLSSYSWAKLLEALAVTHCDLTRLYRDQFVPRLAKVIRVLRAACVDIMTYWWAITRDRHECTIVKWNVMSPDWQVYSTSRETQTELDSRVDQNGHCTYGCHPFWSLIDR